MSVSWNRPPDQGARKAFHHQEVPGKSFYNQPAPEHAHLAGELIFAGLHTPSITHFSEAGLSVT